MRVKMFSRKGQSILGQLPEHGSIQVRRSQGEEEGMAIERYLQLTGARLSE